MVSNLSQNLQLLCRQKRSVSQVCREIGINRQQFAKYLSGASAPSAYNLRRICQYFNIAEEDLIAAPGAIAGRLSLAQDSLRSGPWRELFDMFPGEGSKLRRYLGVYHTHYASPSWPDTIQRGLAVFHERDGFVVSSSIERSRDPQRGLLHRAKYQGIVALRSDRIFIVESDVPDRDNIAETILIPARNRRANYLQGITFGISWRSRRMPFVARIVFKRLPVTIPAREALRACGAFAPDSRELDPVARKFIQADRLPNQEIFCDSDFL